MHPNLPQIQYAEHNRNARLHDAEAHRLRVEAGLYDADRAARRRVISMAVNGVKYLIQSLKAAPTPTEQNAEVTANP